MPRDGRLGLIPLSILIVVAGAITTGETSFAADAGARSKELKLSVEGRIGDIVGIDLTGDGLKDLLVLSVEGRSDAARRLASVFVQKPGRSFPTRPDLVWELDRSIVALDPYTDELPKAERGTLYSINADGIYANRLDPQGRRITSSRVLAADLTHLPAQKEATLLLDFAASWSGGSTEFLVPAFPHPLLFRPQAQGTHEAIALKIPPDPSYSVRGADGDGIVAPLNAGFEFQRIVSADQNGDGRRELISQQESTVSVLETSSAPPDRKVIAPRSYPLDILSDDEFKTQHCWQGAQFKALSGSGRMDVVATVTCEKGGLFEYGGRFLVFKSLPDGSFPRKPDQEFQIENALYWELSIRDLDADGKLEITVPAVKLGVWAMIRAATTHKVAFDFVTVGLGPDGTFDTSRTWKDPVTLRLSSSKYDTPVILLANADNDKITDLIVGTGANEVCVYNGVAHHPERRFSGSSGLCFQADPYARFSKADLDADGKDELIVEQTQSKSPGQLSVILFP